MQLTDTQRDFLNGVHFAVVATVASDGIPHQTVMWYVLDGDQLLLSTPRDSLKHKHLKKDPRLSVCVEKGYTYLTLTGVVRLDEDPVTARTDYQRLQKRYRSTLTSLIVGFMLRNTISRIRSIFGPASARPTGGGRTADLLSRERVTLHMTIRKVQSSGLE